MFIDVTFKIYRKNREIAYAFCVSYGLMEEYINKLIISSNEDINKFVVRGYDHNKQQDFEYIGKEIIEKWGE